MKIFGWAADDAGPGWYRLRVPFAELTNNGHQTLVSGTMPDEWLETADVIVGQRVCKPGAADRWRKLAAGDYGRRPFLVFELDDDLWDIDPSNAPAWNFYHRGGPELLDNLTEAARLADLCTVSTEPLAERMRKINPNVVVLPNQLPPAAFMARPPVLDQDWRERQPFTVGWTGGASHADDVKEASDGLRQFFRRHPEAEMHTIGTRFAALLRVKEVVQTTTWLDNLHEYYQRINFTVGVAPLRPSPFNRAKSEIKFLEYCARGAVTIASRVGPYERAALAHAPILTVSQSHHWTTALTGLYRDQSRMIELVRAATDYANDRAIWKHWRGWEDAYLNGG